MKWINWWKFLLSNVTSNVMFTMWYNAVVLRFCTTRSLFFNYNHLNKFKNVENGCSCLSKNCYRNVHFSSHLLSKGDDVDHTISPLKGNFEDVKELLENAASFNDQLPQTDEQVWSTAPYPKGAIPRSQAIYALRPSIDPKDTTIILFPGQGTQYVGMGRQLLKYPIVNEMFEHANEILGYDLLKLCLKGPKQELDKTIHCQPAVLMCSLAALEQLKDDQPSVIENCIASAGFSVGEITALTFAGVMSFERGNDESSLYYIRPIIKSTIKY